MMDGIKVGAVTLTGRRAENQDSIRSRILLQPNGCLSYYAIVADGMGGHVGGAIASEIVVNTFEDRIKHLPQSEISFREWIDLFCEEVQRNFIKRATYNPELHDMGSTMTAIFGLTSGVVYGVNLGDSRIYCIDDEGVEQISKDHSDAQTAIEEGLVTIDQLRESSNLRSLYRRVTRSFGDGADTRYDLFRIDKTNVNGYILCSDGMSGSIGNELIDDADIISIFHRNDDAESIAVQLAKRAFENGSNDNISVIVIKYSTVNDTGAISIESKDLETSEAIDLSSDDSGMITKGEFEYSGGIGGKYKKRRSLIVGIVLLLIVLILYPLTVIKGRKKVEEIGDKVDEFWTERKKILEVRVEKEGNVLLINTVKKSHKEIKKLRIREIGKENTYEVDVNDVDGLEIDNKIYLTKLGIDVGRSDFIIQVNYDGIYSRRIIIFEGLEYDRKANPERREGR